MNIKVPYELITQLDGILNSLNESKKIKKYGFLIGNPDDVHLKDFDDSTWNCSDGPVKYKRNQGTTWFRFDVAVPEKVMGIPVKGAGIRLSSFFLAPIDTYVDGELKFSERTWMDFRLPEIILTQSAVPGQVYKVAARMDLGEFCYSDAQFSMDYIIDSIEDAAFEINSFKEELTYACRFSVVHGILPGVFKLISDSLDGNEGIPELIEKIKRSRDMLKPMELEAKKRTVHMIGHAHIDMNWFWTFNETLDVIKRDFRTMTQIMEETPDFKFSQSQCVTYEIAEKLYPETFEKIKKFIKSGNWDVTASTWVEGDMNMASGESIARHILYSKKYLKEKCGFEPRILWCPDTFGHSANIPQIAKKGGIDYYYFMRCGKEFSGFKTDDTDFAVYGGGKPVFWWEGLDGSSILALNMCYASIMNTTNALMISKRLEDLYGLKDSMYVYGTGDHGGGPTKRDISRVRQLNTYPTVPKIEFSTTHTFFDSVVKEKALSIPVEKGELNFVFDGCYTTHADIKRYNRKCENMLASTEALGTIGSLNGLAYSYNDMESAWKSTLFNQFHDIFDGSGIKATYNYSSKIAEEALNTLTAISEKSVKYIASKIKVSDKGVPVAVFNTTGWERSECMGIKKPDAGTANYSAADSEGNRLAVQTGADKVYIFVEKVPSLGYKVIYLNEEKSSLEFEKVREYEEYYEMETKYYNIEIKKYSGEIATLYDKVNNRFIVRKEKKGYSLKNGILNTLQVHYELPGPLSAWTIGTIGRVKNLVSGAMPAIKEDGPVVKIINFRHEFDNSVISQDISIYNDSPRIDFSTHVKWNEYGNSEKEAPMLKACFIPDINNRHATYEIPYGAIDRPCKDMEVPGLKWVDISDENNGFSLINDCKYGHRIKGNAMEITLIRSGWEPDNASDIGNHDFIYSILPHKGSWSEGRTIKEGYCLNSGLIASTVKADPDAQLPEVSSFVEIDNENVVISAFKPAESGDAIILRLYEGAGIESKVKVVLGFNVHKVQEVDLNESKTYCTVDCSDNAFEFNIGRFEIKTFKLYSILI